MKHPDVQLGATIESQTRTVQVQNAAAAVVLKPGVEKSQATRESILKYLRENVAPYKVPKVIEFMDELPTSGVGKILKRELKKQMVA